MAGRIDPSEESGEWVAGVSTIMSGAERRRLLARTRRGKERKRREGRRAEGLVGLPLGVRLDPATGAWSCVEPTYFWFRYHGQGDFDRAYTMATASMTSGGA